MRDGTFASYCCDCSWCIDGKLHSSKRRVPAEDVGEELQEVDDQEAILMFHDEQEIINWYLEELEWERDNGWM